MLRTLLKRAAAEFTKGETIKREMDERNRTEQFEQHRREQKKFQSREMTFGHAHIHHHHHHAGHLMHAHAGGRGGMGWFARKYRDEGFWCRCGGRVLDLLTCPCQCVMVWVKYFCPSDDEKKPTDLSANPQGTAQPEDTKNLLAPAYKTMS